MTQLLHEGTLDFWFRPGETAPTRPTAVWLHIWSVAPSPDGTGGTRITGSGQSPIDITGDIDEPSSSGNTTEAENTEIWDGEEVISSEITINAVTFEDADSGSGRILALSKDTSMGVTVAVGERFRVEVGAAVLRMLQGTA